MNLAVNNQEIFKQILLHIELILGISTFSQNNCQPFMPSEECFLASKLSTIYDLSLKSLRNKKATEAVFNSSYKHILLTLLMIVLCSRIIHNTVHENFLEFLLL